MAELGSGRRCSIRLATCRLLQMIGYHVNSRADVSVACDHPVTWFAQYTEQFARHCMASACAQPQSKEAECHTRTSCSSSFQVSWGLLVVLPVGRLLPVVWCLWAHASTWSRENGTSEMCWPGLSSLRSSSELSTHGCGSVTRDTSATVPSAARSILTAGSATATKQIRHLKKQCAHVQVADCS